MTDLEITRLCAEAMGYHQRKITDGGAKVWIIPHHPDPQCAPSAVVYDPLHDDAQAMALVKKCGLNLTTSTINDDTELLWCADDEAVFSENTDLNRAICECVAKMQAAK